MNKGTLHHWKPLALQGLKGTGHGFASWVNVKGIAIPNIPTFIPHRVRNQPWSGCNKKPKSDYSRVSSRSSSWSTAMMRANSATIRIEFLDGFQRNSRNMDRNSPRTLINSSWPISETQAWWVVVATCLWNAPQSDPSSPTSSERTPSAPISEQRFWTTRSRADARHSLDHRRVISNKELA